MQGMPKKKNNIRKNTWSLSKISTKVTSESRSYLMMGLLRERKEKEFKLLVARSKQS